MKLNLYDENLKRTAIINSNFVSCLWKENYNDAGNFTLEMQDTEEYRQKFRPDCYIGRSDRKVLMIIKTVVVKNGRLVASGKSAVRELEDVAFIGKIPAGSIIPQSIKTAYYNSEKAPNIEIPESNLQDAYSSDISNKSFLEICKTMCQSSDVGFKAVKSGEKINVEFYKPEEKANLKFSRFIGNLQDEQVTMSNENFKNYAIVLGRGEDENRTRVDVDLSAGAQKYQIIIDARDIQREENETDEDYQSRLEIRGIERLLQQTKTWNVSFVPYAAEFGSKYDLGDIVTVYLMDYQMTIKARITAFQQKEQNNLLSTVITVGSLTIVR